MHRHELTSAQWERIEPLLARRTGRPSKAGDRQFVNAVIWIAKTGAPWRDLHPRFGPWKTVYNRFRRFALSGVWKRVFEELRVDVDPDGSMADATIVRAHQHAAGGKGDDRNDIGRSRGGLSTKVHALVGTLGQPLYVELTPGQRHEATVAEALIDHAHGEIFLGDTAYDSKRIRDVLEGRGIRPVIRPHPTRRVQPEYDRHLFKERHLVEIFFGRLKQFRRLATRYDKTTESFAALIHLACACMWAAL